MNVKRTSVTRSSNNFSIARILGEDRVLLDEPLSQDVTSKHERLVDGTNEVTRGCLDARSRPILDEDRGIEEMGPKRSDDVIRDPSRITRPTMGDDGQETKEGRPDIASSRGPVATGLRDKDESSRYTGSNSGNIEVGGLTWLRYTRYRPPKLPRRSNVGRNAQRRPGVHPRIPFSCFQLQVLEDRYRKNPYLSRNDAIEISTMLCLHQSRVKIWFQNRRARERRESHNTARVT